MLGRWVIDAAITETEFQAQVVRAARMFRWMVSHMTLPQRSEPGVPDLLLVRSPRVIFMELKSEKGRLDTRRRYSPRTGRALPNQKDWKDALEGCPGVEYYLWRPRHWDEIMEVLM